MTRDAIEAPGYPEPTTRLLLTVSAVMAVFMVTLDGTIAVIALPHIQSNLSASAEQIAWVLTSYLIAGAIGTPLSGWLADRYGRTRVMAVSVAGFTLSSIGCGIAPNLETLVVARLLQGLCGASLVPLSQVLLLDINPPERHGSAIAVFGIGTLIGPVLGPALGGWLTEFVTWRAIFLINVPVGRARVHSACCCSRATAPLPRHTRFDLRGFGSRLDHARRVPADARPRASCSTGSTRPRSGSRRPSRACSATSRSSIR